MARLTLMTCGFLLLTWAVGTPLYAFNEQQWQDHPEDFQNSYQCVNIDPSAKRTTVRYIIVSYSEQTSLPCQVDYEKPTEGKSRKGLWRSSNTLGYCEEKATNLASKLRGVGWTCLTSLGINLDTQFSDAGTTSKPRSDESNNHSKSSTEEVILPGSSDEQKVQNQDYVLPIITLEKNDLNPIQGENFELMVTVTDDVGVKSVMFYHKLQGSTFTAIPMESNNKNDQFSVILKDKITSSEMINYYILAEDVSDNSALYGNSISPLSIHFVKAEVTPEPKKITPRAVPVKTNTSPPNSEEITNKNNSEISLWKRATFTNSISDYERYLKSYPYGNYITMAQARLNYLKKKSSEENVINTPPAKNAEVHNKPTNTVTPVW